MVVLSEGPEEGHDLLGCDKTARDIIDQTAVSGPLTGRTLFGSLLGLDALNVQGQIVDPLARKGFTPI